MQLLDALQADLNVYNSKFDRHLSLVESYLEFASTEYDQKKESADLQYVSESSSEHAVDTLKFLYEEAEEGFIDKTKRAIGKVGETSEEFFSSIKARMDKFNKDLGANGRLKKIQRKVDDNPFLKKATVNVNIDQAYSTGKYDTLTKAILKSAVSKSTDDVRALEDQFSEIIRKNETSVVTDTVEALIVKLIKQNADLNAAIDKEKEKLKSNQESLKKIAASSIEQKKKLNKLRILLAKICKRKVNCMIDSFSESIKELSSTIKKTKGKDVTEATVDPGFDLPVVETDSSEIDDFMADMFAEMTSDLNEIDNSRGSFDGYSVHNQTFDDMIDSMMESCQFNQNENDTSDTLSNSLFEFATDLGLM